MIYPISTLSIILICITVAVVIYSYYKISDLNKKLKLSGIVNKGLMDKDTVNTFQIAELKAFKKDYESALTSMSPSISSKKSITPLVTSKKESNSSKKHYESKKDDTSNKKSDEDLTNLATLAVISTIISDDEGRVTATEDKYSLEEVNEPVRNLGFSDSYRPAYSGSDDSSDSSDRSSYYSSGYSSSSNSSYDSGSSSSSSSSSDSSSSSSSSSD